MCIPNQVLRFQWFWDLPVLMGCWRAWEERELCSGASEVVSWSATKKGEKQNSATTEISFSHIVLSVTAHRACLLPTSEDCAKTWSPALCVLNPSPAACPSAGWPGWSTACWGPCVQGHLAVPGKGHFFYTDLPVSVCPSAYRYFPISIGNALPYHWPISPVTDWTESQCYYLHDP